MESFSAVAGSDAAPPPGVADLLPVGVLVVDAAGAAQFANRTWTELTGQRSGDWRGQGWLDLLDPAEREVRRGEILSVGVGGATYTADWTIPDAGEGARALHIVAMPDMVQDQLVGIVITADDVTAERAHISDLALRATHDDLTGLYNRAQFASFVQHAIDRRRRNPVLQAAVILIDVDDLKATNDTFGHHAGDRLLQTVAARVAASVRPADIVARYGGDEFAVLCEDLHDEAEGITIANRIREAILQPYDGDGECSASVGVASATGHAVVSELVREADRAMYSAKRDRVRWSGPVDVGHAPVDLSPLAIAAHELRSPLTAIAGYASLLGRWRDGMPDSEIDGTIEIIVHQARRLSRFLDDLLDLGSLNHRSAPSAPVDVADLVAQALELVPPPSGVTVTTSAAPDAEALQVFADESRILRALVNLLTNAYQHGGATVVVTPHRVLDYVIVDVEDDGTGIAPELVPHLFDLFTRGTDGEDPVQKKTGTGLGLAIAKQAVESVGGRLRHSRIEPHGARFTLLLPAARLAPS